MPSPIVTVPADLWVKIRTFLCKSKHLPFPMSEVSSVDVPDLSPEAEERRRKIVELAENLSYVDQDGEVEVDSDARLAEGNDNGCYVSAWVWCPFDGTEFDKEKEADED